MTVCEHCTPRLCRQAIADLEGAIEHLGSADTNPTLHVALARYQVGRVYELLTPRQES